MSWSYKPAEPCDAPGGHADAPFVHHAGYLPAGNEMAHLDGRMDEEAAIAACAADARCAGFTHEGARGGERLMQFKSDGEGVTLARGWQAFKKRAHPLDCSARARERRRRSAAATYRIDVLRESPPVYIVHDFVAPSECEWMVNHTLPRMGPSVVVGGGVSPIRQSYSVNMVPEYDDETHVVTGLARRKFAFAREVGGYAELVEGPGQEPINAVYYFNYGDEYRAHCDGECAGNAHRVGGRLATSLSYCTVAEAGGHTLFTRSGLKVVPRPRQMLFFGYKLGDGMDTGHTEHSGCPLRRGRKWIATMWYRDGVSAERDWSTFKFT
jgi:prolyl 4-hydroxylase